MTPRHHFGLTCIAHALQRPFGLTNLYAIGLAGVNVWGRLAAIKASVLLSYEPQSQENDQPLIVALGECMIELGRQADGAWRVAAGGDTFNTAIYLSRLGQKVAYFTALGEDPFSAAMKTDWKAEGLDMSLVLADPTRLPGLYAIQTDHAGERTFYYWRENSAARRLFHLEGIGKALAAASNAGLLYLSGITLSLFDDGERQTLMKLAASVRDQGGQVVFDPNYRAKGWRSQELARDAINRFAPFVSIALPTFEDEKTLYNDPDPETTLRRWRSHGAARVAVKLGSNGCLLGDDSDIGTHVPAVKVQPVDTTGAGDSFNASFIAALLSGKDMRKAAIFANAFAATVIQYPGAIAPVGTTPMLQSPYAAFTATKI